MSFKKMFYLCIVLPMLKAPMGKRWADIHMVKGVFVRFGFDAIRISQIQRQVKNKATKNASWGVLYTVLFVFGCILHSMVGKLDYIFTLAWGFRRCSFRLVGQCESLYSVERVTEQAPRFFCMYKRST